MNTVQLLVQRRQLNNLLKTQEGEPGAKNLQKSLPKTYKGWIPLTIFENVQKIPTIWNFQKYMRDHEMSK